MSEYQRANIRVSDREREDALGKLGEHMSQGRLDIEEFGERSAKVTTAKTRGEVLALFDDLPDPKPAFGRPAPIPPVPAARPPMPLSQRILPVVMPVALVILAVGLTFALRVPIFFLLPVLFFFANSGRRRHFGHDYGNRWRHHR